MSGDRRRGAGGPAEKRVACPSCDADAFAVVPDGSEVVEDGEDGDGKVWVDCFECDERFLVYYRE